MFSLIGYDNPNNQESFQFEEHIINQHDKSSSNFLATYCYDIICCEDAQDYKCFGIYNEHDDLYVRIVDGKILSELLDNLNINSIDSYSMQTVLGYLFNRLIKEER